MAQILSGKDVAAALQKELLERVEKLKEKNITPTLAIVRVGEKESDIAYERGATKKCGTLGIAVRNVILPGDVAEDTLLAAIEELNLSLIHI